MYCEVESNLYLLKNNTYSPELRQTLSMNYLDEIVNNFLLNFLDNELNFMDSDGIIISDTILNN